MWLLKCRLPSILVGDPAYPGNSVATAFNADPTLWNIQENTLKARYLDTATPLWYTSVGI